MFWSPCETTKNSSGNWNTSKFHSVTIIPALIINRALKKTGDHIKFHKIAIKSQWHFHSVPDISGVVILPALTLTCFSQAQQTWVVGIGPIGIRDHQLFWGRGLGMKYLLGLPHDTYFAHVYIIIYIYNHIIYIYSRIWQWKIRTINHLFIDDWLK